MAMRLQVKRKARTHNECDPPFNAIGSLAYIVPRVDMSRPRFVILLSII